jgi:hypothetical protein
MEIFEKILRMGKEVIGKKIRPLPIFQPRTPY